MYSSGSLCFGSLLESPVRAIRGAFEACRESRVTPLAALAHCVSYWFEEMVYHFNKYAFVQMATYGKAYKRSANDAWSLVCEKGIEGCFKETLTDVVVLSVSIVSGLFSALIATGWIYGVESGFMYFTFCAWMVGHSTMSIAMQPVESIVNTVLLSFAEEPSVLDRTYQIIYLRLKRVCETRRHASMVM
eukprot:GFYU01015731.1.p1 GENE.GFYU01015731.1~~GFYU01015731.1.p1  ORF type:complete len:189 (-),score=54.78 GFYU01015731.1:223-789(-)